MKDETIIHCPQGHPADWHAATEPESDTGHPGTPPMWRCEECEWESAEHESYEEYIIVRREEMMERQLGYTL